MTLHALPPAQNDPANDGSTHSGSAHSGSDQVDPTQVETINADFYFRDSKHCTELTLSRTAFNKSLVTTWFSLVMEMLAEGVATEKICAIVAKQTFASKTEMSPLVRGLITLSKLPKTLEAAREYCHLDIPRINTIGNKLRGLEESYFEQVDEFLWEKFTPKLAFDELLQARTIGDHLREFRERLEGPREKTQQPSGRIRINKFGNYHFGFNLTPAAGEACQQALLKKAKGKMENLAQAFQDIMLGDAPPQAIIHVLVDQHGEPYLEGAGWLDEEERRKFETRTIRRMRKDIVTTQYRTPAALGHFIRGRDGVCRFPGCTVRVNITQFDHVIGHAISRRTAADNLHCLCQHHHNLKTRGIVSVTMDERGVATWTMPDGSIIQTKPEGPFAELWLDDAPPKPMLELEPGFSVRRKAIERGPDEPRAA